MPKTSSKLMVLPGTEKKPLTGAKVLGQLDPQEPTVSEADSFWGITMWRKVPGLPLKRRGKHLSSLSCARVRSQKVCPNHEHFSAESLVTNEAMSAAAA